MKLLKTNQRFSSFVITTLVFGLFAGEQVCHGQYETPQLHSLSRTSGQVGTSFELSVLSGSHLDEITEMRFSNPSITAVLQTLDPPPFSDTRLPDYGKFMVTVPADLEPGRYETRVLGRHGVSNPRAMLFTALPNQIVSPAIHNIGSALPIAIGTLFQATSTSTEVDYYQIEIAENQPVRIELFAQQLDSRLIGQLKLLDKDGREVALSRGADGVDPSLQTTDDLPAGDYIIAVNDFLYRGGDKFHYQLLARSLDEASDLIGAASLETGRLPSPWATRAFSNREASGIVSPTPEPLEIEKIAIPFEATRQFADDQRETVFEFPAEKGASLAIEIISQRAGEPTDARATVRRVERSESGIEKLHDLGSADDWHRMGDGVLNLHTTDPQITITPPVKAFYRLHLRDLDVGTSLKRRQSYKVRIRPPEPSFDLVAYRVYPHSNATLSKPFGSKIFRGGAEVIRVFALRRGGFTGAIKLTCDGLPAGLSASETFIAPNQSQTQISIAASMDASAIAAPFEIIGRSEDDSIEKAAVPATIQWEKGAGRDFIQTRLATSVWVAASEQDIAPVSIALGDMNLLEAQRKSSIKVPIKLVRRQGGKAACTARARDLPPGVTASDVTIAADKDEAEIEFKIADGAKAGTYSLWLQVETKIKLKPNPQALERAQHYRTHLQTLLEAPAQADQIDAIKAAIAAADKRVQSAEAAAKEKEMTVFLPTSNATLRVVDP